MKEHLPWIVPSIIVLLGVIGFFVKDHYSRSQKKDDTHDDKLERLLVGMARIETKVESLPCLRPPYPAPQGNNGISVCPEREKVAR